MRMDGADGVGGKLNSWFELFLNLCRSCECQVVVKCGRLHHPLHSHAMLPIVILLQNSVSLVTISPPSDLV